MPEGEANGLCSGGKAALNPERKCVVDKKKPEILCPVTCIGRSNVRETVEGTVRDGRRFLREDGL